MRYVYKAHLKPNCPKVVMIQDDLLFTTYDASYIQVKLDELGINREFCIIKKR